MIDTLINAFASAQAWVFQQTVQPALFHLGLMEFVEEAYDAVETGLLGVIEIGLLYALLRPLEAWRPVERWQDRASVRSDVIYTWLHRLGVLPLVFFLLLYVPVSTVDGWLRMHDIVRPSIEDLFPFLGRNSAGVFVVYLVMLDFVDYWVHRLQHRVHWWWALHSLHHSQRQMSFWADDRNHLIDDVLTSGAIAFAALLIGVHSSQFILFIVLSRMLQSLSHVNARLHFGAIGNRVLVSPVYHRMHHAIGVGHEGSYQGCNFATLFPLWDMLFRTANFKLEYLATGVRDQLEGRDYGAGFWRQQWLGLIRMRAALARWRTVQR